MKNVKVHSSSDSPNGSWGAGSQDVTALRAEIERLTAENERLKRSIDLCSGSCSYQQNAVSPKADD